MYNREITSRGLFAFGDQGRRSKAYSAWRKAGTKITTLHRGAAERSPTHVGLLDPAKTFVKEEYNEVF